MNMSESSRFRLTPGGTAIAQPLERAMHATVVSWAHRSEGMWPELRGLYHVPNGELRENRTGQLLKRLGQKNGVPDFILPTAHAGYIGLAMELKRKPNTVTEEQQWWLDFFAQQGHLSIVSWSDEEAIDILREYVSAPRTVIGPARMVRE